MMWLKDWRYRKVITLSRAAGAVSNYQIKLKVGQSSGSAGADVHCEGNCKTDFSDIRFTNTDGTNLAFWFEGITGSNPNQLALTLIKFDSIGTTDTTFYMYYGNSSATSYSNFATTIDQSESFEDGTMGLFSNYYSYDYFSVQTTVHVNGTHSALCSDPSSTRTSVRYSNNLTFMDTSNKTVEFWFYMNTFGAGNLEYPHTYLVQGGILLVDIFFDTSNQINATGAGNTVVYAGSATTWYRITVSLGATSFNIYVYSTALALLASATGLAYGTAAPAYTCTDVGMVGHRKFIGTAYWDFFYSRKYSEPEPAYGTWSSQQQFVRKSGFSNFQEPGIF